MDFHKRTNERNSLEGVTNPSHRETTGKIRDRDLSTTVVLDALVKVNNGFSKPYVDDTEGGDTCKGSREPRTCWDRYIEHVPTTRPTKPLQAHVRWTNGLSSCLTAQTSRYLSPHLARAASAAKKRKKSHNSTWLTAMKCGVPTTGSNMLGTPCGSSFKSNQRRKASESTRVLW